MQHFRVEKRKEKKVVDEFTIVAYENQILLYKHEQSSLNAYLSLTNKTIQNAAEKKNVNLCLYLIKDVNCHIRIADITPLLRIKQCNN